VNGKNISLKEMTAQGKYVWVLFWRLWSCGHCRQQLNEVEMVYKEVKAMGGEVLALSTNSVEHTKQVVKELALEFPIIADPEAKFVKKYEVFNLDDTFARPSTFVVNNKGEIIFKHVATDITNRVPPNTVLDVFRAFLGPAPASAPLNP
jgi:peroxiredoxin